ncbi:SpoIIAA-like [Methanophagales archaeon]|nr:SpoIIAA-like [Methanophagales archaeon]
MFEKLSESSGNVIGYKASGKLTAADYERIEPEVEDLVKQVGDISMLLDLEFDEVTMKAMESDLAFGRKFHKNIDKLAIVGDKKWEKWMASMANKIFAHEAKHFHTADMNAAWAWLREN